MDDAVPRDELMRLRERAYGPRADIVDDPVALARLRELEGTFALARAPEVPRVTGHAAPAVPVSPAAPVAPAAHGTQRAEPSADAAVPAPSNRRAWRRTVRAAAWVVSILVAAGLASALTWAISARHPDAVLQRDPTGAIPATAEEAFGGAVTRFVPFHGIVLLAGGSQFDRDERYDCLGLTRTLDGGAVDVITTGACAPAGLAPVLDVVVADADLPDAFTESYPAATAVRFVQRDQIVEVYIVEGT